MATRKTKTGEVAKTQITAQAAQDMTLLATMETIVPAVAKLGFGEKLFEKCNAEIAYIANKLRINGIQAVLLALFFDNVEDSNITIRDLTRDTNLRNISVLRYSVEIDRLIERKFIRKRLDGSRTYYRIPVDMVEAVKRDECYEPKIESGLSCNRLFELLATLFSECRHDELNYDDLCNELHDLIHANTHLTFVRRLLAYGLPFGGDEDDVDEDGILLLYFCHLFVNNGDNHVRKHDIEYIFSHHKANYIWRELTSGKSDLMKMNLVDFQNKNGVGAREEFCMTDSAKRELFEELNISELNTESVQGLVLHDSLASKQLFYNRREQKQIDQLASLLSPENFVSVQQRLSECGMRRGFACLFYGSPGTGKTETVYQLARRTGRNIMPVNVEEIKSMWVGGSEKNIKAVFDRYRSLCAKSDIAPILLFNEADAIIGKRQEGAERAVDKMENSVQNIILQEMESLDGILIATTNLTQNMDKAFERRFIYKIEFERPEIKARAAIWQSMLGGLDEKDAAILAERYPFSGGQIENIARKRTVEQILSGGEVSFDTLCGYCDAEQIGNQTDRRKIGF